MCKGNPCYLVQFLLEEEDGDEMLTVKPNHIVCLSVEGTQLVGFKLILFCYWKVDFVFEKWVIFQAMNSSVLSEDGFSEWA